MTNEIIGILDKLTTFANSSSLNATIKSSVLPPPLAIIITSGLSFLILLKPLIASIILLDASVP